MTLRTSSLATWAFAAALLLLAGCSSGPAAPRPNVLLIVVDSLRRDHLGAYGYDRNTSPHIDRLAAESVRYDRAVSQAPWTLPSVAGLLTSRDPAVLGIEGFNSSVAEGQVLLSEVLRAHGYATGAVVSHTFVSAAWGFGQGFDSFDESNVKDHQAVTSPGVTEKALAFVREHRDRDFFLFVHYFDPHFPYREHEGFVFEAEEPYEGRVRAGMSLRKLDNGRLGEADARELRRIYDSEIAWTDHHIGRLLDGVRALGLMERTLVVFTADHGEEFLDHGKLGHGRALFEELVGVPLLLRYPDGAPGVVDRPVALLDVYPTVLEAAGIEIGHEVEGRSLRGEPDDRRVILSATRRRRHLSAAIDRRHKLVRAGSGETRLYDLDSDPGEMRDLSAGGGEIPERLEAALRVYEGRLAGADEAPGIEIGSGDREALRALGYVDE